MKSAIYIFFSAICFFSFSQNTFELNTSLNKQQIAANEVYVKNVPVHKSIVPFELNERILKNDVKINDNITFYFDNLNQKTAKVTYKTTDVNQVTSIICKFDDMMFSQAFITFNKEEYLISIDLPEQNRKFKTIVSENRKDYFMVELDTNNLDQLGCGGDIIAPEIEKKAIKSKTNQPKSFSAVNKACCSGNHENLILKSNTCESLTSEDDADIRVLIIYTQASLNHAGSQAAMNNIIAQAMTRANNASINSTLGMNFILAHSELTNYVESTGGSGTDLDRLRINGDGHMDNVHTLRNTHAVDFVHLFSFVSDTGGLAYLLQNRNGSQDLAFGMSRVQQADWTDTFIHELGHNMSASHAAGQNVQAGPTNWTNWPGNNWTAGWRFQGNNGVYYSDLMTYGAASNWNDGIGSTNISYFSTPLITFQGQPIGNAVAGDNTRSLKDVKQVVSKYRDENTLLYCAANGNNPSTSNIFISNVSLNGINNSSSWTTYNDYTFLKAQLVKGNSYPLTANTANTVGSCQLLAWIDWNEDGDFDDANEQIFSSAIGSATSHSTTINIPTTASEGQKRLRIRFHFTGSGGNNTACGSSSFGEVEDYFICLSEPSPPTIATASCGTTINNSQWERINADVISGATQYRFKMKENVAGATEFEVLRSVNFVHFFDFNPNWQYGKTYEFSVQANVGGSWTAYGPACLVSITAAPKTSLTPVSCGATLTSIHTNMALKHVDYALGYRIHVKNMTSGITHTFTRTGNTAAARRIRISDYPNAAYSTTFKVWAEVTLDGTNYIQVLESDPETCDVITPAAALTTPTILSATCGITLSRPNQHIISPWVHDQALTYFHVSKDGMFIEEIEVPNRHFSLTMLAEGYDMNATYQIKVRYQLFGAWSDYSATCNITTAAVPNTQLNTTFCNQNINGINVNIRSAWVNNYVNTWAFEVSQGGNLIGEVEKNVEHFKLNEIQGLIPQDNVVYSVRVKVKIGNTWGVYGNACTVGTSIQNTIPTVTNLTNNVINFDEIIAYPNPFYSQFTVKLANDSVATISVFDINGRLVENRDIDNTFDIEMGHNLNSGVYILKINQNNEIQSFKMIKR